MNTSLLAGLGVGSGIAVLGFLGTILLIPPMQQQVTPRSPLAESEIALAPTTTTTPATVEPDADQMPAQEPLNDGSDLASLDVTGPVEDEIAPDTPQEAGEDTASTTPPSAVADAPAQTPDPSDDARPVVPPEDTAREQARVPGGTRPIPERDPDITVPQAPTQPASRGSDDPVVTAPPADDMNDTAQLDSAQRAALPDTGSSGLPQISAGAPEPEIVDDVPGPDAAAIGALERNALFQGDRSEPRMALVLGDPGLPMAMRRSLAALDFPFTVALNPMDTTAAEAAAIYRDTGKEVLILATSIPEGATASDLDVTFSAFFKALPMAVGVIDLPQGGFARNARLLNEILPILRDGGHGLVTFSGGLSQATRAAQAAGVAHAEVFRIIDSGNESAFTMRRFLDRALFQASQMGEVIVYGDASNDTFMEAIEMWRTGRMLNQIALVQISGVLPDTD